MSDPFMDDDPILEDDDEPTVVVVEYDAIHEQEVEVELQKRRIKHKADELFRSELAAATFSPPMYVRNLKEDFAQEDDPEQMLFSDILAKGDNVTFLAQFKVGKTTLIGNAARAYADGVPFLGRFNIEHAEGNFGITNLEMSHRKFKKWLQDMSIENPDRISLLSTRGHSLPLTLPHAQDFYRRWLLECEIGVWAVDPLSRLIVGIADERVNDEVRRVLDILDQIKESTDVHSLILSAHTLLNAKEGEERGRGSAIHEWPDVMWKYNLRGQQRTFATQGRYDHDVPETPVRFDPDSRLLTLGDVTLTDERVINEGEMEHRRAVIVTRTVSDHPGLGAKALEGAIRGIEQALKTPSIHAAARLGLIKNEGTQVRHSWAVTPAGETLLKEGA